MLSAAKDRLLRLPRQRRMHGSFAVPKMTIRLADVGQKGRIRQCKLDPSGGHSDVLGVKKNTLRWILSPLGICLALLCCAAKSPPVVPLGDNTYSITCEAPNAFQRDLDKLKAAAQEEAAKFCSTQGKQLKVVALTTNKPYFSLGFCKATIVFRALNPGEPELTPIPAAAETTDRPTATGDLYSDLIKLDDLRKKGILTEEEFQAEKKKALNRSK